MILALIDACYVLCIISHIRRDTKDVLIVTNCGAESIAFLKVYGVVPAAALFMLGYNFLSNHVSSRTLFHLVRHCLY
jgi:ATP/ADP translocase